MVAPTAKLKCRMAWDSIAPRFADPDADLRNVRDAAFRGSHCRNSDRLSTSESVGISVEAAYGRCSSDRGGRSITGRPATTQEPTQMSNRIELGRSFSRITIVAGLVIASTAFSTGAFAGS